MSKKIVKKIHRKSIGRHTIGIRKKQKETTRIRKKTKSNKRTKRKEHLQQQHKSRFLEAPLVRQANGELKKLSKMKIKIFFVYRYFTKTEKHHF